MPYIKERREELDAGDIARNAGELNYQISRRVLKGETMAHSLREDIEHFCKQFVGVAPNYQKYNDMTGALINSCVELCRRGLQDRRNSSQFDVLLKLYTTEIAPYEDTKIISNGDIL
jgi:hypothetical protein